MKDSPLTIIEYHPPCSTPPNQVIRKTITGWLTKELRGRCPGRDAGSGVPNHFLPHSRP